MQERRMGTLPGPFALVLGLVAFASGIAAMSVVEERGPVSVFIALAAWTISLLCLKGMFTMAPNEARVLQLFGRYAGTVRDEGWLWVNPFYSKRGLSLRMRSFETARIKVNDLEGNPIEIAAIVVWRVVDTARALREGPEDFQRPEHHEEEREHLGGSDHSVALLVSKPPEAERKVCARRLLGASRPGLPT